MPTISFLKSILDPTEIFHPMSLKKVAYWTTAAGVVTAGVYLENQYQVFSSAISYENFGFMGMVYALEPVISIMNICLAKYPPANPTEEKYEITEVKNEENQQETRIQIRPKNRYLQNQQVAIVIPCHNSEEEIPETLRSCLRHVEPEQIFVVDNGNSIHPPSTKTQEIVKSIDPHIHYAWSHYGNKNIAQYVGALLAENYKYILTIDDDVHLPENVDLSTDKIQGDIKAICYTIHAVHPEKKPSLLVEWQDIEYKFSDLAKLVQSRFGGVLYPHGAVSLWDREIFLKILKQHDTVFFAEDVKLGLLLQKMGYKMQISAGASFDTDAPTSLIGESPNYYEQRVRNWEMGRQVHFFKFLNPLLTVWKCDIPDIFIMKLFQFYDVYGNVMDWWRFPLLILMADRSDYWARVFGFLSFTIVPALLWNYVKLPYSHREDLQCSLQACLTLPIYKIIYGAVSFGGALRTIFIYHPNSQPKPMIDEIEKREVSDRDKLEAEIKQEPMMTFKRLIHNRFFTEVKREADDLAISPERVMSLV